MKCYGLIDFIGVTTLPNRKNPQDGDYLVVAILDGLDSRKFFVDDGVYRKFRSLDPGRYLCEMECVARRNDEGKMVDRLSIVSICETDPFKDYKDLSLTTTRKEV